MARILDALLAVAIVAQAVLINALLLHVYGN